MIIKTCELGKTFRQPVKDPGLRGALKHIIHAKYKIKEAVSSINMEIDEGEAVAYVGPNGAGKSTTIKMLTGILHPTQGSVSVCGIDPAKNRIANAKNIGVVFGQRTQLWWDIPICETYSLLKELYEIPDSVFQKRLSDLVELLGMEEFLHLSARRLSLGQRMRADLAASLLHSPRVLFLDEPTIGLDIVVKKRMREFIKTVNEKEKTTILLTTHDLSDIEDICKRIIIINEGRIFYDGDLQQVKDHYAHERTLLLSLGGDIKKEQVDLKKYPDISWQCNEGGKLSIVFDKFKYNATDFLHEISGQFDIQDFTIIEPKIEEVITKMYSGQL